MCIHGRPASNEEAARVSSMKDIIEKQNIKIKEQQKLLDKSSNIQHQLSDLKKEMVQFGVREMRLSSEKQIDIENNLMEHQPFF